MEGFGVDDTRFWFSNGSYGRNGKGGHDYYWSYVVNPRHHPAAQRFYNYSVSNQEWDHSPVIPILSVIMLAITVFLLILFRQNPGLVAGTVAGCLIIMGIYLLLSNAQENKIMLE